MSYIIYCIAYRITDEMKAKKEAEKPFWWEHLHSEVKDKTIEEIDKLLLEGGIPKEKLDEMTKHEKYMAISEGCYVVDCREHEKEIAELETLRKEIERNKTSFINQHIANNGANVSPIIQEELKPIEFGKVGEIPSGDNQMPSAIPPIDPMSIKMEESPFSSSSSPINSPSQKTSMDIDDEHLKILSDNVKDDDLMDDDKNGMGMGMGNGMNMSSGFGGSKPELKKYAQSIVRQTVQQINNKADEIPDDVALLKEQELLQAVINELQGLK